MGSISRGELRSSVKFMLCTSAAFAAIYALSLLVPLAWVEYATAAPAAAILSALGIEAHALFGEPALLAIAGFAGTVQISGLCTGLLELIVVWAAIIATFEVAWKKRAFGVLGAFAAAFAFNQLRIVASIFAVLSGEAAFAELVHGVLFRVVLFAVVAGYYAAWLWWATHAARKGANAEKQAN